MPTIARPPLPGCGALSSRSATPGPPKRTSAGGRSWSCSRRPATWSRSVRSCATIHRTCIITTGGTGITSRDSTYEAIAELLEKRLDGFGELFRVLSYQEVGSAAMLTRACAGVARGTVIFMLPGSENAVRLGMTKLILPEIGHVVRELRR